MQAVVVATGQYTQVIIDANSLRFHEFNDKISRVFTVVVFGFVYLNVAMSKQTFRYRFLAKLCSIQYAANLLLLRKNVFVQCFYYRPRSVLASHWSAPIIVYGLGIFKLELTNQVVCLESGVPAKQNNLT